MRQALLLAAAIATTVALGGCNKTSMSDMTASFNANAGATDLPAGEGELRRFADDWGNRYDANRRDKRAAITYARALRALGQSAQATAVMQGCAIQNPNDMLVLGEYGKALADTGRLNEAAEVLGRAHTPERPNPSILSAQGSVADKMGDHAQAQGFYQASLKIKPNDPAVLSNLGLSYALSRDLARAEGTLRDAVAQPGADVRVRQNFALVLALQGKFAEAEDVSRRDLQPIDAAANVQTIRRMIAESNTWKDIRKADKRG